jgi:hypothetical protein
MSNDVQYRCGKDKSVDLTAAVKAACKEPRIPVPVGDAKGGVPQVQPSPAPGYVRVQCSDDQWCDFPCDCKQSSGIIEGIPVPKEERDRWVEWRKYSDPVEGLKRLNTYSNWVLGAQTILILLASGLASSSIPGSLDTPAARWLFGAAVAALGFSWVFISFVKAPAWGLLNRHSPAEHREVFSAALGRGRRWFAWAAGLLSVALTLAALIPLAEVKKDTADPPRIVQTFSQAADSSYQAAIYGEGLRPNSPVEVRFRKDASTGVILPVQRVLANPQGVGTATVAIPAAAKLQPPFLAVFEWEEMEGGVRRDSIIFTAAGVERPGNNNTPTGSQPARNSAGTSAGDSAADDSVRS